MIISNWLRSATKKLRDAGVGTARLDAIILLEDALGKDRSWLLAHPEATVQGTSLYKLNGTIARRAEHEPLAYIRGKTEFYAREFYVNKHVLEPRPESEAMIDIVKELGKDQPWTVVDVGTGSGCLAITTKLELPKSKVIAIDIDPNCLKVARKNSQILGAKVKFCNGDLLEPLTAKPTIILANLPYVPEKFQINQAALHEPKLAIYGGKDGLNVYRRLFDQIKNLKQKPEYILTEALPFQHEDLELLALENKYKLHQTIDLVQSFRL